MFSKAVFDQYLEKFPARLMGRGELSNLFIWDAQQHFAKVWDIEKLDFDLMYAESLHSDISNRLWIGVDYQDRKSVV